MNSQEALAVVDSIAERLGDDTQLEAVTADLVGLKEFLMGVDGTINSLNEELSQTNEKNIALIKSNNVLFRQIGQQQEIMDNANEEIKKVSVINSLF